MVTGLLESLALKCGSKLAGEVLEWSKGSEPERLVKLLKDKHKAAPKLLLQPDCLFELRIFATTGQFDRAHMLAAVSQVEPDGAAAQALVDAIETTLWRTKRGDELLHLEMLKLRFDLRQDASAAMQPLLERLEALGQPAPTIPRQLPRVAPSFTDRTAERARLADVLRSRGGDASAKVIEICGMPGVGKSVLAARVGHDVRNEYADGQLYESLCAPDGTAIALGDAIANLLRALGVADAAIPTGTPARAALLRTQLASRSVLLILDNVTAADPELAALIPASPGCGVILTSSTPLAGVDSDECLALERLSYEDAVLLLERLVGDGRIAEDRDASAELIARCGSLPLALHAVAGWLKLSPQRTSAEAAERLRNDDLDDSLQRAFALPYAQLSPAAASLFRRFGIVRAPTIGPGLASALALSDQRETDRLLAEILAAGLAERAADGVRLHELIHRFAAERLRKDSAEEALASECVRVWVLAHGEPRASVLRDGDGGDG